MIGWILSKQAEFSLAMRGMLRSAKSDGTAVWGLLGLSFLYGVFHAMLNKVIKNAIEVCASAV